MISQCFSTADIESDGQLYTYFGGICGYNHIKDSPINCFSTGALRNGTCTCGIGCGYYTITNCYSISSIVSNGEQHPMSYNTPGNNYWSSETYQGNERNEGTKLLYLDLFKENSYSDWDFENVWQIDEGSTTPYLKWAGKIDAVKKTTIDAKLNQ